MPGIAWNIEDAPGGPVEVVLPMSRKVGRGTAIRLPDGNTVTAGSVDEYLCRVRVSEDAETANPPVQRAWEKAI